MENSILLGEVVVRSSLNGFMLNKHFRSATFAVTVYFFCCGLHGHVLTMLGILQVAASRYLERFRIFSLELRGSCYIVFLNYCDSRCSLDILQSFSTVFHMMFGLLSQSIDDIEDMHVWWSLWGRILVSSQCNVTANGTDVVTKTYQS